MTSLLFPTSDIAAKVPETLANLYGHSGTTVGSVYDLPDKLRHMADFAHAPYRNRTTVRGYATDPALSDEEFYTFVNGDSVVFAIRGSHVAQDFYESDVQITTGQQPEQYKRAKPMFDRVNARYPDLVWTSVLSTA